jgi:CRP-like cAMP-binding protein
MQYKNPQIELCLEGSSSVFKGLNSRDKENIIKHHTITRVNKGGFLFKEGEKTPGLICLVSGKVKIFKVGAGGREQIIKMVKKQELIGYRNLFDEHTWSYSSAAVEDSVICILEKRTIAGIIKKNEDVSYKLNRLLCDELRFSYNRIISLTQKHVRARLAESLLMLIGIYGFEDDGKTLSATLSRDDIAHLSNMTTSNAIRTLSALASEGNIELKGRKIKILDRSNLERISALG